MVIVKTTLLPSRPRCRLITTANVFYRCSTKRSIDILNPFRQKSSRFLADLSNCTYQQNLRFMYFLLKIFLIKLFYQLRSVPNDLDSCSIGDSERHDGLLLTLDITGSSVSPSEQDMNLPERPYYISNFLNYTGKIGGYFVIEANSKQHLNREKFSKPNYYRLAIFSKRHIFITY